MEKVQCILEFVNKRKKHGGLVSICTELEFLIISYFPTEETNVFDIFFISFSRYFKIIPRKVMIFREVNFMSL